MNDNCFKLISCERNANKLANHLGITSETGSTVFDNDREQQCPCFTVRNSYEQKPHQNLDLIEKDEKL